MAEAVEYRAEPCREEEDRKAAQTLWRPGHVHAGLSESAQNCEQSSNQNGCRASHRGTDRSAVPEARRRQGFDEPIDWPNERILGEIKTYLAAVEAVPEDKRAYMDESFAYTNEAPTHGRAPKGERVTRPREHHGKKLTFLLAIRKEGNVHMPWIIDESVKDHVFVEYVRDHLVPHLRAGETVSWDRLGRSGRAKNPVKQHYNPEVRKMIEDKGCSLLFLPPKGKHFNPIEVDSPK